ncbi:MAG: hypothetical protein PUC00_05095 [Clostridiales bacterium]|nr:hypothetical protein [Clostridiales bacterium]
MKELVFLPDREGRDDIGPSCGFVRMGADGAALRSLADRLVLPPKAQQAADTTMWRGVLALALLCDAWPEADVAVTTLEVDGTVSLFASWVLSARPAGERRDALHLALLERDGQRRLLGIADAHRGLVLPATPTDFTAYVPERAAWYDAENDTWHDPVPYLNEHERAILLSRLTMMELDAPEVEALKEALSDVERPAVRAVQAGEEDALAALSTRIQAVCALTDFDAFTERREPCYIEADNALVRVFSGVDVRYAAERTSVTYLWHGVAFARTSAALGLTGTNDPGQEAALAAIEQELLLLTGSSTRWNSRCAAGIVDWLSAQDAALLPEVRAQAEIIRHVQSNRAMEVQQTITLTWPWDASSGAMRYLLRQALGDGWMQGAAKPFSDYLTKLTGHALGDHVLHHCCACADGILLPPLSREMAMCVAACRDGEGLAADMLRFTPREDGGITASYLLRGAGEVRLERTYAVEEILVLSEAVSPCVAVWPCVPLESWRAYHVFVRGGEVAVAALSGGQWTCSVPDEPAPDGEHPQEAWRCLHTESYPACLCLMRGEACLGALPNALPLCKTEAAGAAQVSIDMGASATAVVITVDGKRVPATGENLTRLLVMPQEMPEDDFLLSLTPNELTPSSVLLCGEGDELFTDGYVYAVTDLAALRDMTPGSVCTALKWRADARSVRARRILMHQVMLGASLNAMLAGAGSIRWRVTVADEMADAGRDALLNMVDELSVAVAAETGLALQDGQFHAVWAEEAAALHAYLRTEGGMKGAFAVLDIGGSSVKTHLWMPGRNRPLGGAIVLEGATAALLDSLRVHPEMLYEDFADCGDETLISDVNMVCEQLTHAGESAAQSDKARMMLDALLEKHKAAITAHLYARFSAQQPTYLQGILLEMYASALFIVGLMLEQAGNDTKINHLFPGDLSICVTGRGAWLLDTLTPQMRNALQRIAHEPMQLRHPVRSLTLRPMQLPAMGTALGMSVLKDTSSPIDPPFIRTRQSFSELMRMLTLLLCQCYPMHMWKLHPGLLDPWGKITPAGEDTIRRVASACYGEGEDIPAAVMAFTGKMRRAAITQDAVAYPGESTKGDAL